jgi:2-amino-4-hydroxy-6-hydroxymethyldihydropteridine diphosphokinase
MNKVFLLIGGNLGDRKQNLDLAVFNISKTVGKIKKRSAIYESKAWGKTDQPDFLNQVILLESKNNANEILNKILKIETNMGRNREEKWAERLIDIDILFFNDAIIETENLKIPHPLIQERMFALKPMAEIDTNFIHPILNKTISELIENCKDELFVEIYKGN